VAKRASASHTDSNGRAPRRARAKSPPGRNAHDDGELLKEAVANPGSVEIADERPVMTDTVVEIPAETLDPPEGVCGQSLSRDANTMVVPLGKPSSHSWVELFADRVLTAVMLPVKQQRDGSPVYYWVAPSLRGLLKRRLRQVQVHLVYDCCGEGDCFLWLIPASEFSPYYAAMSLALAKGDEYLRKNLFQFEYRSDLKKVEVTVRARGIDDPAALLPSRPLTRLLPEALKAERLITSTSHPMYVAMTQGARLT
jgi:hypothetical protein